MKTIYKYFSVAAGTLAAVASLASCSAEAPFSDEGEGIVRMSVVVNSNTTATRAKIEGDYAKYLEESCRIYISNDKGVLHKWKGISNIPAAGVSMRYGSYVAEAFAGDSVTASFDSKYFKGRKAFTVGAEASVTQVNIKCNIANVVASIDEATIEEVHVSDLKVIISNTRGELTYYNESLLNKGYFMMPNGDTSLAYTVTGKDSEGNDFTKNGVIADVKPTHEYRLQFQYHPEETNQGGAFLTIVVEEEEILEESEVEIYGRPAFSWVGNTPEVGEQLIGTPSDFGTHTLRVAAYNGFESLTMTTDNSTLISALGGSEFELQGMTETGLGALSVKGINVTIAEPVNKLHKYFIEFSADFLKGLPASQTEYVINIAAEDKNGKKNETLVRIANTEAAIVYADPIILDDAVNAVENDFLAVRSTYVELPVNITKDDIENPAIQYRQEGASSWTTVPLSMTRSLSTTVKLSGLTPSTRYEYRAVAGAVVDGSYEFESEVYSFTTESKFIIPNASMEDWSNYSENSKVLLPAAGGTRTFWDSGNHGSATMNKTLTQSNSELKHSGNLSAELKSQFVGLGIIGKFAAGNLFAGTYVGTDGTDGILEFGREYDGSHPNALSVWANYRPGIADSKGANNSYLKQGELDKAQIYVALSTKPIEILTKNSQKLFSATDSEILAYGQVTLSDNYGPDGELEQITIPLEYYERAKNNEAKYLIIVCSASLYGDYFCGGEGSVLYLDDFELVYE